MPNTEIQNNQIPVGLTIQKWDKVFYIVKNFYENYQKEIEINKDNKYKIILSSDLKSNFNIDSNKTIKISNSFFGELKNDKTKIYLLENEISKLEDSKWLNLKRFKEYIDNLKLDWKYCLLSDKEVFLGLKEEIKRDINFFDRYNFSDTKYSFLINEIDWNSYSDIEKYSKEIDNINEKIKKLQNQDSKQNYLNEKNILNNEKNLLNKQIIDIKTQVKKYQEKYIEELFKKIDNLSNKAFDILKEKIIFSKDEYYNLTTFERNFLYKEKDTYFFWKSFNSYEELEYFFNQYGDKILNFKKEILDKIKFSLLDKILLNFTFEEVFDFKYQNNSILDNLWQYFKDFQKNKEDFFENLKQELWFFDKSIDLSKFSIKKINYNYLQNYKKYLLEKYKESSPEIINFIQNIYYLPKEYWDKFDGIKDITFDESKFKTDNKLSLYWFQQKKWQEFDYIINQDIFWVDKKYTFNKVKKTKENKLFQLLTLDKIDTKDIFLIDENISKNNKDLIEKYESNFENFHKDILPVFFVEWSSYYVLDKDFNKIDYYFIKYDTKIWNNTKYFSWIWEIDFVIFPYKWLDWFVDQMIKWLNNNLKKESWDLKSWKVKTSIKQTNFYTNKTILKELDKILKKLRNNLNKTLEETQSEDYLYNIKQIDNRVLLDISSKIDYKVWDDLQEKLKKISHQKIVNYSKVVSLDNVNNRLLKYIIKKIYIFIKDNEKLKSKADTSMKLIKSLLYDLDEVIDIQNIWDINIDNSIIMNYEYFSLLKLYNDWFKFVNWLSTHIDEDDFIKSITKIFELYCFEHIKELLEEIEFEKDVKIDFEKSKSQVINKTEKSYVSHQEFISDKFADKSQWIDTEWFLETDFKWNKLRLILWDIYHKWTSIQKNVKDFENKIFNVLDDKSNIYRYNKMSLIHKEKEQSELKLLYPENYQSLDYTWIFWKEFNFNKFDWNDIMTPDLSIEIRDKNSNFITKTIIFDAKFSAIIDELTWLETPNKERFTGLQKYKKIWYLDSEWIFKPFLESPIMIMYPWNITNDKLKTFKTINNILKQNNNMLLIPIYSNQDEEVKIYIKDLLKNELENI